MRTSYSRRELYALGEPIGDSATRIEAGRRVYGGGGGGIPIVSDVVDAVSDVGGSLLDLGGSAINTVTNIAGDALEPAVKVGEWSMENPLEAAALAAGAYYGLPALMGEGAGAAGAMGAAEGAGGLSALDAGMGVYPTAGLSEAVGGLGGWDAAMADLAGSVAKDAPSAFAGLDQEMADLVGLGGSTPAADSGIFGMGSDLNKLLGLEGASNVPWAQALSQFMGGGQQQGTGLTGMGALAGLGGLAGIKALLDADKGKYGVPGRQAYTGPMSQFKYSPSTFAAPAANPNMFRPQAGTVRTVSDAAMERQMGGMPPIGFGRSQGYGYDFSPMRAGLGYGFNMPYFFAEGGETSKKPKLTPKAKLAAMDPWTRAQAELGNAAYRAQMPVATATMPAAQQMGQLNMASGGISDLGGYSDGGRMLKGPGDGMSDSIPATIGGKREARLADNEFVVPADVVSHLGNGSSDAGAKQLYKMMDRVRTARTGHKRQGKQIDPEKYLPA